MKKYIQAFLLYFILRETIIWFRESTNEWVYEVRFSLNEKIYLASRYPAKYKATCYLVWFKLFWSSIKDISSTL